jgi:hypothetical protein
MLPIDDPDIAIAEINRQRAQKRMLVVGGLAAILVIMALAVVAMYSDTPEAAQDTTLTP